MTAEVNHAAVRQHLEQQAVEIAAPRTLYEITDDYARALEPIISGEFDPADPAQSEALEQALDQFEAAGVALRQKAQAVAKVVLDYEGDVAKADREEARVVAYFAAYRRAKQERIDWLNGYLLHALHVAETDRIEGGWPTVRIQLNPPATTVLDEALVPASFLRHIPEKVTPERWEVNKVAVNENYKKTGEIPPGVTVSRTEKVVIG